MRKILNRQLSMKKKELEKIARFYEHKYDMHENAHYISNFTFYK